MLAGFVTRWAGMCTLRKFFSANVAVQSVHRLIIKGPYRWARHPGYFGGMARVRRFGIALGNGIGLLLLAVGTLPAFFNRIAVEERASRRSQGAMDAAKHRMNPETATVMNLQAWHSWPLHAPRSQRQCQRDRPPGRPCHERCGPSPPPCGAAGDPNDRCDDERERDSESHRHDVDGDHNFGDGEDGIH